MKLMQSGLGVAMLSLSALAAGYYGGRPLLEHVEFARAKRMWMRRGSNCPRWKTFQRCSATWARWFHGSISTPRPDSPS